jgi:hypothetical protein
MLLQKMEESTNSKRRDPNKKERGAYISMQIGKEILKFEISMQFGNVFSLNNYSVL